MMAQKVDLPIYIGSYLQIWLLISSFTKIPFPSLCLTFQIFKNYWCWRCWDIIASITLHIDYLPYKMDNWTFQIFPELKELQIKGSIREDGKMVSFNLLLFWKIQFPILPMISSIILSFSSRNCGIDCRLVSRSSSRWIQDRIINIFGNNQT